ncbi:MAG: protein-export chaperone SecB [Asticcacaulis sp.]
MTDVPAETPNDAAPVQVNPEGPVMRVLAQYVRDFSFENPRAPESLRLEGRPDIDMGVEMNARGRADGLFEVDLKLRVDAKSEEGALFTVELVYGGLFQIGNVTEDQVEPMLLVECPRFLFPFARRIIADATADGGFFPPFMMEPIDFTALYMAQKSGDSLSTQEPAGQA